MLENGLFTFNKWGDMKRIISLFALVTCFFMINGLNAQSIGGKKVLYIDSYHEGYGWSDGIKQGVQNVFSGTGAELKITYMDTKRNTSEGFKKKAALKAKGLIERFKPDVVIACDDNASKYLIMPYFKDAKTPFVFCGVNWDATVYGYPYKNVTGMIEVTPVPQLLDQLSKLAKGNKIGTLAPELLTARKEVENYRKVFNLNPTDYYAKSFADYKKAFLKMQKTVDVLILLSDGGLYNDKRDELNAFVMANSKIPSGASYDFLAERALISFAKISQEQGEWAANAAIRILRGTSPSAIPIVQNKKGALIINAKLAEKMGVDLPYELAEMADKILE